VAYALAAAAANDRGEARACVLMGASPLGLAVRTWPVVLAMVAPPIVAGMLWGGARAAPSSVLGELLASSRASCGPDRPVADVPGTGAAWLCDEGGARLAIVSGDAVATVRGALFGSGAFEADGVVVSLRGPPEVHLRVARASIKGLAPFESPAGTSGGMRGAMLASGAALSALAIMAALLASAESRRAVAASLGAVSAALPLVVAGALDRAHVPSAGYLIVGLVGVAPPAIWAAVSTALRRRARARVAGLGGRWYA
jgi:hypothetical protein